MENKTGIKLKEQKVQERMETKRPPIFLTGFLAIILIATYIFTLKFYEPAKNIILTGGIMVYPLSFLIVALISKYYGFKEARKSIYISSALYLAFIVLIMIGTIPHSNNLTSSHNAVVQYLLVNNFKDIGSTGFSFYYPTLGQFFGVVVAFLVSHLLYATIYNAIKGYTIDYLAVGLGLFITYILDRLIFIPMLYAKGLYSGFNTFEYLIQCLTSEFITSIIMTILIIIVYVIITSLKKPVKN